MQRARAGAEVHQRGGFHRDAAADRVVSLGALSDLEPGVGGVGRRAIEDAVRLTDEPELQPSGAIRVDIERITGDVARLGPRNTRPRQRDEDGEKADEDKLAPARRQRWSSVGLRGWIRA